MEGRSKLARSISDDVVVELENMFCETYCCGD